MTFIFFLIIIIWQLSLLYICCLLNCVSQMYVTQFYFNYISLSQYSVPNSFKLFHMEFTTIEIAHIHTFKNIIYYICLCTISIYFDNIKPKVMLQLLKILCKTIFYRRVLQKRNLLIFYLFICNVNNINHISFTVVHIFVDINVTFVNKMYGIVCGWMIFLSEKILLQFYCCG